MMKEYQGEKAIISLTSWKARINTVGKTIFNLYKMCPGFHIVLCLSEEEFPKKEKELPVDLMLMANANIFEILWVYKNYKAFKKVIFTINKYRDVPVISADDDCIYTCNYAKKLYDKWKKINRKVPMMIRWSQWGENPYMPSGPNSLYYGIGSFYDDFLANLSDKIILKSMDDDYMRNFLKSKKIYCDFFTMSREKPFIFHDVKVPLHPEYSKWDIFKKCFK